MPGSLGIPDIFAYRNAPGTSGAGLVEMNDPLCSAELEQKLNRVVQLHLVCRMGWPKRAGLFFAFSAGSILPG